MQLWNTPPNVVKMVEKDALKVMDLLVKLKANLWKLFLHQSGRTKLHTIFQRKNNSWSLASKIDELLEVYENTKTLEVLIMNILRIYQIQSGISEQKIDVEKITSTARALVSLKKDTNTNRAPIISALLQEIWMSEQWVEAFFSQVLDRKLEK